MGCSSFGQRGAVKVRRWVVVAAVLIGLAATACSSPAEEGLVTGGTEEEFFASLSALMPAMTQHERDALAWAASDLDLAAINTNYAMPAGLIPVKDALVLEDSNSPYANIIAARSKDKENPQYKKFLKAYQSEEVKKFVNEQFKGSIVVAW